MNSLWWEYVSAMNPRPFKATSVRDLFWTPRMKGKTDAKHMLEHLHPWTERHALEMRFEGLQACTKIFWGGSTPPPLLAYWLFSPKNCQEYSIIPKSGTIHWIASGCMGPRNVGVARATLTREDSEWSWKFEEPWQSRPRDWRGVGHAFIQGRVKGLAACQVPLARQGEMLLYASKR